MLQRRLSVSLSSIAILGFFGLLGPGAEAQTVEEFYKEKRLQIIIRTAPGGSYDQYSRLLARHVGKHIPGHPTAIPQYMPGGGGLLAINYVANIAPKDGTVLTIPDIGLGMYQALGMLGEQLKADLRQFSYIGNFSTSNMTVLTYHTSNIKTLEDAQEREVLLGTSGAASISAQMPAVYNSLLGTKFKLILGYEGDQTIAMERGEIHGRAALTYAATKITTPHWIKDGKVNFLLQIGFSKEKDLPNVPLLLDLAKDDEQKQIFEFLSRVSYLGRVLVTGPGVPPERVEALRKAFMAMMSDPAFLEDAARTNAELSPLDGPTVEKLYLEKLNTDPRVLARLKTAMQPRREDLIQYEKKR